MKPEQLISILIDDDIESFKELLSNVTDYTFKIKNEKYKYPIFLMDSQGAPFISIAAYFGAIKCYDYLADTQDTILDFQYNIFCYACAGGNMRIVRDVSVRFPDYHNFSIYENAECFGCPGFHAINNGHYDVFKYLILKGYTFNEHEIIEASYSGQIEMVDYFWNNSTKLLENNILYFNMLKFACLGGNETILQKLLAKYPFKKLTQKKYENLIYFSCSNGSISCLKCLINNIKKFFHRIPVSTFVQKALLIASSFQYLDIISYVIKQGGKYDDITSENSILQNAIVSGSYDTAKFYLEQLPKIPTEIIMSYFQKIFSNNYSILMIELLLIYINKTIFDMKELFSVYAIQNNICEFFDYLKEKNISFDFIKIEYFDDSYSHFDLFIKLYEYGAPLKFDIHNKVFLNGLYLGKYKFIEYAISNGAILNDEIIKESNCLKKNGLFYQSEQLIKYLLDFNIDLSPYQNFLEDLISNCGNKKNRYELLAIESLKHGAVVTKEGFKEIIASKFNNLFKIVSETNYYQLNPKEIYLYRCSYGRNAYIDILKIIFEKQPELIDYLNQRIDLEKISGNIADFVKSCRKNDKHDDMFTLTFQDDYIF